MSLREEIEEIMQDGAVAFLPAEQIVMMKTDTSERVINKVLDAAWPDIKTMQQALLEMEHAQSAGPGWYTNGEPGLKKQVRMWLYKGLKSSESLNKLRQEK